MSCAKSPVMAEIQGLLRLIQIFLCLFYTSLCISNRKENSKHCNNQSVSMTQHLQITTCHSYYHQISDMTRSAIHAIPIIPQIKMPFIIYVRGLILLNIYMYLMHCIVYFSFALSMLTVNFSPIDPLGSNSHFTELLVHFSKHMPHILLPAFPLLWHSQLTIFVHALSWIPLQQQKGLYLGLPTGQI